MYQNFPPCIHYTDPDNHFDYSVPYTDSRYSSSYCSNDKMAQTMELARAYVPRQPYGQLLPLNVALKRGSVFSNINLNYPRP